MKSEDFNKDGLLQWGEAVNAMIRAQMGEADFKMVEKFVKKHGDKDMTLTPEGYMKVVAEFDKMMKEKEAMKGGNRKRMEIHMEEHPDGRNKMVVIMEGAQKLAISAAAVASAALFSY